MKKILILILFLVFISSCTTGNIIKEHPLEGPYLVTYVVDGDTLDININGKTERIRFSGINTPEKGECYYSGAKEKLKELTLDKEIYIQQDITNRGNYGRLLRYVYLDNILINEYLVENGYAKVYDKYKEDTSKYYQLKAAEAEAIRLNKGVWNCSL
ncbi:MAG: thermonuclease family protein [Patescibacteria group bacterium]